MSEINKEVKTYMTHYACDECEKIPNPGCILRRTGFIRPTNPPTYVYECPHCKKEYNLSKSYPNIYYE